MPRVIDQAATPRPVREQVVLKRRGAEGGSPSGPPPGGGADVCSARHHELDVRDTGLFVRNLRGARGAHARTTADQSNRLFAALILIGLGCLIVFAGVLQLVDLKRNVADAARDAAATREMLEQRPGGGR